jgi:LemA protein
MSISLLLIIIIGIILLYFGYLYNRLITTRMRVNEAFSQIDVQLKRRTDLIPNLVETVKGYAKHEKDVLENVTKARASLMQAGTTTEKAQANDFLSGTLKSLFAVAENYPNLKASENFLELQEELSDTENKIAYSRQFYNSNVMDYNTKLQVYPDAIIANMFHFKPTDFFGVDEKDREPVKVSF